MNISIKTELDQLDKKKTELIKWLQNTPGNMPVDAIIDKQIELHEINTRISELENELSNIE
jgi:hypothetical protein